MKEFTVDKDSAGRRADVFIAGKYPEFTRSSLQSLFEHDKIKIDGEEAKAGEKLHGGEKFEVDDTFLTATPEPIDIPVLFEDKDVVVMNKPAGVLTHSKGALNLESTVASFLFPKLNDKKLSGNRAGIVHRLDRGTSGLIIGAKTEKALKYLQKEFSSRRVKKIYLAIVEGKPKLDEAIIDAPIARNLKNPQTFKVDKNGKPAQTQYKVIKNFSHKNRSYSLLDLLPVTGRTHQLRIHLTYIGHPIVGDHVYGHGQFGDSMYLHAKKLELSLPSGKVGTFAAPVPKIFKEFEG
jgi:23S rRNA pseudouridine1911/1915/1917 synthase